MQPGFHSSQSQAFNFGNLLVRKSFKNCQGDDSFCGGGEFLNGSFDLVRRQG
jgi:hypothetical protein